MKNERKIYHIGQRFRVMRGENGRYDRRKVSVRILKLYKNFALCRVNERFNECFDYRELAESEEMARC